MADERTVIELVIEGAQRSVVQVQSVARAQTELVVVQESLGVRQRKVYNDIAQAAEQSAIAQEQAAKKAEQAAKRSAQAAESASTRQRDPATGRFLSRETEQQQRIRQEIADLKASRPTPEFVRSQVDAASFTAARNALVAQQEAATQAAAKAQTLQGRLQALGQSAQQLAGQLLGLNRSTAQAGQGQQQQAQAVQQQAGALRQLATQAQQAATQQDVLTRAGRAASAQLLQTAAAANRQANALAGMTNASSRAGTQGITYLSVLSAIHAASFLSTSRTFSLIGSFTTLSLAFSKVGAAGFAAGAALGGILAVFGAISAAIQTIQQITIQGATALAGFAGAVVAASVATAGAGVKMAADIETQLASVRAFGGATTEELKQVSNQATELSIRFGVSAASIVEATSLFARAGGTVKEAIEGATEAIIQLQVASQGELSLTQSAITLSAAMKQFGLDGTQAIRVVDNLTAAAQGSALSFTGVQQAFVQAAPGAAAMGISIEQLSAAIALLGDQLIKGTTTGTAFKQFIIDVVNPTRQAKAALAEYGINLEDANGNALSFIPALQALNKGLSDEVVGASEAAKAERARVLTIAFGSRAALAANILTREGTKGLQEYSDQLAEVTASNIVNVLLLPLNKQLERIPIVAQAAGAAFGGPLLQPARAAAVQIIGFLDSLRGAAELLGQTVRTILIGQGFEALQTAIDNLVGHNALSSFFIELINSARNVKDVIESQIIPAVLDFGKTLISTFGEISGSGTVGSTFESINVGIRNVGIAAAVTIGKISELTREFILGIGVGGELRQRLLSIAQTVATHLVASFQVAVVVMGAAVAVMPALAQAALLTARFVVSLANVVNFLRLAWHHNVDSMLNTIEVLAAVGNATRGNIGPITELSQRMEERAKEGDRLRATILAENAALNTVAGSTDDLLGTLQNLAATYGKATKATDSQAASLLVLQKSVEQIANELIAASGADVDLLTQDDVNGFIEQAGAMREAARQEVGGLVTVFDDAQGSLGSILDNIIADVERRTRDIAKIGSGTQQPGAILGGLSAEELARVKARIDETGRDVSTRLQNLAQDSAQRVVELIARSMERLDDIKQRAIERITEIEEAANERIRESRRTTDERREDRDLVAAEKEKQDNLFEIFQRGLDRQAVADQRALDDRQRRRAQDNEDFARSKEHEFQDAEAIEQRKIQVVQRAFDIIQQAREQAFDRAQQVEATAFQRTQQAQAELRQFGLQLAKAKTPEERAQLTRGRQEAIADTKFQQGQENALLAFRIKQEEAKLKEQRSIETQTIGFRQGLEERFLSFKRGQEVELIKFRRAEETKELAARRQDEDAMLALRLQNEDKVQDRRKQDALELQGFQDKLDDKRQEEENQRIRDKALKDIQKEVDRAQAAAQEVKDKLFLDLVEQTADVQKQIRNIINALVDLADAVPPELLDHFLGTLGEARKQAESVEDALGQVQRDAKLDFAQTQAANQAEILQAQARAAQSLTTPGVQPALPRVPGQVLSLQTMQVAQVILPASFNSAVALGVVTGFQLLIDRGVIPSQIDIDLLPITDRLDRIGRGIG